MRLCTANGRKALFHRWDQRSKIVNPSPGESGQQGGTIQFTNGIVEYEDGVVDSVPSYKIVFKDTEKLMDKVEKEIKKWEARKARENEPDDEGIFGRQLPYRLIRRRNLHNQPAEDTVEEGILRARHTLLQKAEVEAYAPHEAGRRHIGVDTPEFAGLYPVSNHIADRFEL